VPQAAITTRTLTADDWPIVEQLFGRNGACAGCWCMYWRVPRGGRTWSERSNATNRSAFQRLVERGAVHGVLAFAGDEPVGWCCLGPRADFPRLETVRALPKEFDAGTWSVVCFFVRAGWREHGVASAMLERAVRHARAQGARTLEGYPVKSPGKGPIPAAFAWTGVGAVFDRQGFERQALRGYSREYRALALRGKRRSKA
jgi:GNAT superfamily N-acetyltransferase